jgi:hypothetical protein
MNSLFEFNDDFEVEINPQVLTLSCFKKVLDKYKDKRYGISELSYIAFMCNPKSEYSDIRDEKERSEAILLSMSESDKLKIDKVTQEAIDFYKSRSHTPTSLYLDRVLNALDKTGRYFDDVDYSERDMKGSLVYDPKKVIDSIKESPKLMQAIRELKEQIKKEQEIEGSIRGSGQKGIYEDGD